MNDKRMRLGAVLTAIGQHVVAWRHRDVPTDVGTNLAAYITAAQTAERGRFDMMFVADDVGVWQRDIDRRGHSSRAAYFEPITLLSALASHTSRLGLVAIMTASFTGPYHVARLPHRYTDRSSPLIDDGHDLHWPLAPLCGSVIGVGGVGSPRLPRRDIPGPRGKQRPGWVRSLLSLEAPISLASAVLPAGTVFAALRT
jgi:hypothetical protein